VSWAKSYSRVPLFPSGWVAAASGLVKLENDKLTVIRLTAIDMSANTKRVVIIIQHADVFAIEYHNILDGFERKSETLTDPHITRLARLGDAIRISNVEEINGQFFPTGSPGARSSIS
jgi:hypothetical protein